MRRRLSLQVTTWWLPPTLLSMLQPALCIRGTLPLTPSFPRPWNLSRRQLRTSPLFCRQTPGMSLRLLLLLPSRPRLSRRRLHPLWPRTSRRMPCDTPLSPLSPPTLTTLHPLPRPPLLVCRLPIWTPQTLMCQSTCECSTSRHLRRLTCHPAWPPISGTSSSPTSMFLPSHRPTSATVTCCSTILIQATLPPSGNHLVDPLFLRAQPRTI